MRKLSTASMWLFHSPYPDTNIISIAITACHNVDEKKNEGARRGGGGGGGPMEGRSRLAGSVREEV